MFTKLRLENFKNFQDATLHLGPFTVLVGENASGKSNIRDAFRFLHGIGRGYSAADILGGRYEGGSQQWSGIRGGPREITFNHSEVFGLRVESKRESDGSRHAAYCVEVKAGANGQAPLLVDEELVVAGTPVIVGATYPHNMPQIALDSGEQASSLVREEASEGYDDAFEKGDVPFRKLLHDMRFFDFHSEAMRRPSLPGQTVLGDRGENLASVLKAIYDEPRGKETLVEWLRELTPMDAADFEFVPDVSGRITLVLVETSGRKVTAYSASDGTLRFLGMIAAMLGPKAARFNFFEELDAGLHPTRLHLLIQLIEQRVEKGDMQVVATTHSPQLLNVLSDQSLQDASLVYRLRGEPEGHIVRIVDLPDAPRLIEKYDLAELYTTGWMENSAAFAADGESVS